MAATQKTSNNDLPRDCWYAVALASRVGRDPFSIPFEDGELVANRNSKGTTIIRRAKCAHRGCSLSGGWLENDNLACPYHGWQYDKNGKCIHIPALRDDESIPAQARVAVLPSQEAHGLIWAWIGDQHTIPTHDVEPIPELGLPAMMHQPRADLSYEFKTHFSRSIENGIDPTHAPFTHGKSIGKVDSNADLTFPSYKVEQSERSLFARMPIKVKKIRGLARLLLRGDGNDIYKSYRFIYPNLLLSLVNFGRFTLISLQAHVPTGPQNTLMLSTNYRNFLSKQPLLSQWFNNVTIKTGEKIALEDDRVIKDQQPIAVSFRGSNEVLIESDRILIDYRRMMRNKESKQRTSL